jgi:hypothetical protein
MVDKIDRSLTISRGDSVVAGNPITKPKGQEALHANSMNSSVPHTAVQRENKFHELDPRGPGVAKTSHLSKIQELGTAARNTNSIGAPQIETTLDLRASGKDRDPNRSKPIDE